MYVQSLRGKKGFTLIEIAVVIMIIGIIIGAVMKGKDIARTAQVKDFLQGFAGKWKAVAETYYDRVGQELSDGSKNGNTGSSDGYMDGISADSGNGSGSSSIIGVAKLNAGMNLCDIVKSNVIQGGACSNQKDIANFRVTGETAGIV
ncbi:MAG: prepilin-type N-terminal cleavage/methylation domain-containing protein, partial [Candidatus Magnetominusculus sp. LBB02]|nr:prepilin-type N-terminal cleavage/methylation domain-containing protein [Candidatus Magnetominusculus sp. LBB02]